MLKRKRTSFETEFHRYATVSKNLLPELWDLVAEYLYFQLALELSLITHLEDSVKSFLQFLSGSPTNLYECKMLHRLWTRNRENEPGSPWSDRIATLRGSKPDLIDFSRDSLCPLDSDHTFAVFRPESQRLSIFDGTSTFVHQFHLEETRPHVRFRSVQFLFCAEPGAYVFLALRYCHFAWFIWNQGSLIQLGERDVDDYMLGWVFDSGILLPRKLRFKVKYVGYHIQVELKESIPTNPDVVPNSRWCLSVKEIQLNNFFGIAESNVQRSIVAKDGIIYVVSSGLQFDSYECSAAYFGVHLGRHTIPGLEEYTSLFVEEVFPIAGSRNMALELCDWNKTPAQRDLWCV
jgi:hypothetical protein